MNYRTFAIFFGGFGLGVGSCYLVMRSRFEKMLDAKVDAINQAFDKEMRELGLEVSEPVEDGNSGTIRTMDTKIFRSEIKKHDYDKYYKAEEESPKEGGSVDPYIISAQQFATDGLQDKITLTYYINAGLVCEEEQALEDPDNVIGTEFTEHFHDDEEGVVYVRNERLGADYEVLLDDSDGEFIRARFGFDT